MSAIDRAAQITLAWEYYRNGFRHYAWWSRQLRCRLAGEQNWRCCYCCCQMSIEKGPKQATLEHLIPRSLGGTDAEHNIVVACWACNQARGDAMWPIHYEVIL